MKNNFKEVNGRYIPIPPFVSESGDSLGWTLRYGKLTKKDRLLLASILDIYENFIIKHILKDNKED